jgi:hypothetical protein
MRHPAPLLFRLRADAAAGRLSERSLALAVALAPTPSAVPLSLAEQAQLADLVSDADLVEALAVGGCGLQRITCLARAVPPCERESALWVLAGLRTLDPS